MHWQQCVKQLEGRRVTIKNVPANSINTVGQEGTIGKFDRKVGKYEIHFHGGWCGWYTFSQLTLH